MKGLYITFTPQYIRDALPNISLDMGQFYFNGQNVGLKASRYLSLLKGQYNLSGQNTGLTATQFFTNLYGTPNVAYSLRKLSPNSVYSGSAIRVRRSSDNTEQNIDFASSSPNSGIDTSSLSSFVGSGDGFVVTWYDQSGNGLDLTQSTASNQPKIVSSGTIITQSGVGAATPAISFDGTDDRFTRTFLNFTDYTLFSTHKASTGIVVQNGNNNGFGLRANLSGAYSLYERGVADHTFGTLANNLVLISGVRVQSSSILNGFVNSTQYTMSPSTARTPTGTMYVGSLDLNITYFEGVQQELIIYDSNKTSQISSMQSNINSYFQIY